MPGKATPATRPPRRGKTAPPPPGRPQLESRRRPPGAVSPGQQRPPIPAGLSVSATPPPGSTRRRSPQQRPPGTPGQEAAATGTPRRARCRRAGPIPCKTPPHPRPPGRPCGLSISRKDTAGRGKMPGKTAPATRPPRRGCQSVRAALSTPAATGNTAAGKPQPPAGGCQSGTATATDSRHPGQLQPGKNGGPPRLNPAKKPQKMTATTQNRAAHSRKNGPNTLTIKHLLYMSKATKPR